ncbi:MAG: hypothetical protein CMK32_08660 [Porticoccaceae bacterium]|nr:hypothetical protein [Porticoccaceae bacterium]
MHVDGGRTLLPALAEQLHAAPALMDSLATEFAPTAQNLATQKTYWLAFNGWMTDRLSGPIMNGQTSTDALHQQAWAVFLTAYWGGMELRENWGMPPAMERLGIQMKAPFTELQMGLANNLKTRFQAIDKGGDACLALLPALMRDDTTSGAVYNIAYNAGAQVVKTEDPPIGQRRPHRKPRPAAVRINARHFMRVDYELPSPMYLREWRSAFERTVVSKPDAYEAIIAGEAGQKNLREIWTKGVGFANTTWGGGANDQWSDAYFDDTLHWSTVVNFGLEAVGLASFVALINQEPDTARKAVMGNTLYEGMAMGWLLGFLDTDGKLPVVAAA